MGHFRLNNVLLSEMSLRRPASYSWFQEPATSSWAISAFGVMKVVEFRSILASKPWGCDRLPHTKGQLMLSIQ